MFAVTVVAGLILAAVALSAQAVQSNSITIAQFAENVQKEASEQCLRRSAIQFDFFDPLYLGEFTVKTGDFVVKNTNTVVTGLSNAVLSNIKWSFDKKLTTARATANVTVTSDFETTGRFLFLPMSGAGKLTVNGYDLEADVSFSFRKVKVKSVEYLEIYNLKSVQKFGFLEFDLKSDGTCSTVDTLVNAALNANWQMLEPTGAAAAAEVLVKKLEGELNAAFRKMPYDEIIKSIN